MLILAVLCGGVALYSIDFPLSAPEQSCYAQQGRPYLQLLARDVALRPAVYHARRLQDFDRWPGIDEAVATWRASHAAAP